MFKKQITPPDFQYLRHTPQLTWSLTASCNGIFGKTRRNISKKGGDKINFRYGKNNFNSDEKQK
jgi:hypothetical protein